MVSEVGGFISLLNGDNSINMIITLTLILNLIIALLWYMTIFYFSPSFYTKAQKFNTSIFSIGIAFSTSAVISSMALPHLVFRKTFSIPDIVFISTWINFTSQCLAIAIRFVLLKYFKIPTNIFNHFIASILVVLFFLFFTYLSV
jgi:hypothetical protein